MTDGKLHGGDRRAEEREPEMVLRGKERLDDVEPMPLVQIEDVQRSNTKQKLRWRKRFRLRVRKPAWRS